MGNALPPGMPRIIPMMAYEDVGSALDWLGRAFGFREREGSRSTAEDGRITIRDDERFVRGVVARLTRTHEASQPAPWKMTDSAKEDIDTMLKAIVGLEIEITRLVGKSKLSQNKEVRDIRGVGEKLKAQGDRMIGDAMLACADAKLE